MVLPIHTRESFSRDFEEFRTQFYDSILSSNGYSNIENLKTEEKDEFVCPIILSRKDNGKEYLQTFKKSIEDNRVNFGRDSLILSAVALNVLSLRGEDKSLPDLTDWEKYSTKDISNAFAQNYDMVQKNPSLAYQIVNRMFGRKKIGGNRKPLSMADLMKGGPIIISKDNIDEMPDFIKQIFEKAIGDSDQELTFTPDKNPFFNNEMADLSGLSEEGIERLLGRESTDDYDEDSSDFSSTM